MAAHTAAVSFVKRLALPALATVVILLEPNSTEAKKTRDFEVGPWLGEVYVDDDTGKFNSCIGSASYRSGIMLSVVVWRNYNWALLLWNEKWNWSKREQVDASYRFNNGAWLNIKADTDGKLIAIEVPDNTTSAQLFKHSRDLDIRVLGETYGFVLTGTNKLLSTLADCVGDEIAREGGDSPSASNSPPSESRSASQNPSKDVGKGSSSGTGFFVSSQGHILTNNHVVKGCSSYSITRTGDTPKTADVLRTDQTNDLAVLKLDASSPTPAALLKQSGVRVGDQIATFGFPLAGTLSASGVLTSGNVSSLAGLGDDVRHFQISSPIQPGNSGGPLLDMYGNVVGITNMKLNEIAAAEEMGSISQNVNFAIKANVAINFLDAHSIPYETAPTGQSSLPLPDIVEKAKSFTVQITCQ